MRDPIITVNGLSKVYRLYASPMDRLKETVHPLRKQYHHEFFALKDISFNIRPGEKIGIIGQNGSGKSTLLKILSGVLSATSGTVVVRGRVSALLELGAGFNLEMTGLENIYFNGTVMGLLKEEVDEKLDDILSFADIGDFINQPVKIYSSGMFVRLAFAVAINNDPDIFIVDEALAVGDDLFQRKCFARIERLINDGKTFLLVSHNMLTINQFCDRSLLIDSGEILLQGISKQVTAQYERLIFSQPMDRAFIRDEIKKMNNENLPSILHEKDISVLNYEELGRIPTKAFVKNATKDNNDEKPYFCPDFLSKSAIEYKSYDVLFDDIHFETMLGEKVNFLVFNEEYLFSYKVKFNINADNVSFGMSFRTPTGVIIGGGASFLMNKAVTEAKKGDEFQVNWRFTCWLLHGVYLADVGVSAVFEEERVYLNRIVDAIIFRVQPSCSIPACGYHGLVAFNHDVSFDKVGTIN